MAKVYHRGSFKKIYVVNGTKLMLVSKNASRLERRPDAWRVDRYEGQESQKSVWIP